MKDCYAKVNLADVKKFYISVKDITDFCIKKKNEIEGISYSVLRQYKERIDKCQEMEKTLLLQVDKEEMNLETLEVELASSNASNCIQTDEESNIEEDFTETYLKNHVIATKNKISTLNQVIDDTRNIVDDLEKETKSIQSSFTLVLEILSSVIEKSHICMEKLKRIDKVIQEYLDKHMVVNAVLTYRDDNGKKYRMDNSVVPNSSFFINGYEYRTDSEGRTILVKGKLKIKDNIERKNISDKISIIGRGKQEDDDERGHLIADNFGGGNGMENLTAQNAKLNRSEIKKLEEELESYMTKEGKKVDLTIKVLYPSDSFRPQKYVYIYSVDGVKYSKVFRNKE